MSDTDTDVRFLFQSIAATAMVVAALVWAVIHIAHLPVRSPNSVVHVCLDPVVISPVPVSPYRPATFSERWGDL